MMIGIIYRTVIDLAVYLCAFSFSSISKGVHGFGERSATFSPSGCPPQSAARSKRPSSHLRMPTNEYHGLFSTRRFTISVSLHDWVFAHMRCHPLRHVEEHFQISLERCCGSNSQGSLAWRSSLQEISPSLQCWLCQSSQRSVLWYPHPCLNDYFLNPLLRTGFKKRIRHACSNWSKPMWINIVCDDYLSELSRYGVHKKFEIWWQQKFGVGQYFARRSSDWNVHLQYVHHHRRPVHNGEEYHADIGNSSFLANSNYMSDNVHPRCQPKNGEDNRTAPKETRKRDYHFSIGDQLGDVGNKYAGEVAGWISPSPTSFLRSVGLDDHYTRLHAAGDILQVPFNCLSLRNLETGLQNEASLYVATGQKVLSQLSDEIGLLLCRRRAVGKVCHRKSLLYVCVVLYFNAHFMM